MRLLRLCPLFLLPLSAVAGGNVLNGPLDCRSMLGTREDPVSMELAERQCLLQDKGFLTEQEERELREQSDLPVPN